MSSFGRFPPLPSPSSDDVIYEQPLAGSFVALLVGGLVVVARGLYLARHLFTLWL